MSSSGPVENMYRRESDSQQEIQEQRVPTTVTYLCGSCGQENHLKTKDAIRCKECGYRIFYKKRTNKSRAFQNLFLEIQFEAR
jgi:DNA-directed RNA polymerase I, II, and III subunit RPABC4